MKTIIKSVALAATLLLVTACGDTSSSSQIITSSSQIITSSSSSETPSVAPSSSEQSSKPEPTIGYHRIEDFAFTAKNVRPTYSPTKGKLNVLIVPINLNTEGYIPFLDFDDNALKFIQNEMFGTLQDTTSSWNTLKTYYETASFNQLEIGGMVAPVYNSDVTIEAINSQPDDMSLLYGVFTDAILSLYENDKTTDWSQYDLNNDSRLDAVHFISNVANSKHIGWMSPLWPHMAYTGFVGTHNEPAPDVYSLSSLGHLKDARTQIHEQGHMLGLEDYYDYSNVSASNYCGGLDMQCDNSFDWNSFSKMSVDWVKPYVVDGTSDKFTITMNAASLTGDCLVIPANYKTWNQSPYDEYFLIELFSPFKNNEVDWYRYKSTSGKPLGEYGVRMYHVDARLWARESWDNFEQGYEVTNLQEINDALNDNMVIDIGPNNSLDGSLYAAPCPSKWLDYKLLTLIQADKQNTLGRMNHNIDETDLFHEGDVFTFADYGHFLSKARKEVKTMDNGESFPYKITFDKMSKREVTMTIEKI